MASFGFKSLAIFIQSPKLMKCSYLASWRALSRSCATSSRAQPSSADPSCDSSPRPAGSEAEAATNGADGAASPVDSLQAQIATVQEERDMYKDKYTRSLAERENLRVRMEKLVENAKMFSIQSFSKDLLNVADILAKATDSVPGDQITDANPHLKNLFEGLKMTEAQLLSVFRRHGLEQMEPLGAKFDPNQHEAMFEQPIADQPVGHVVAVASTGYTLHGRVVRPAQVGLAKAST